MYHIIQQNCGKGYECTISALEAGLGLDAAVVCTQEPFLGDRSLSHSGFNLYWPSGTDNRKDMRVLTAVRKDILNIVIIDNRTDLVSHPYCSVLDIKELHFLTRKVLRRTRVVNLYDNKVVRGQVWEGSSPILGRAIQDISWRQIINGRVLIVGDVNAHSSMWNPHCRQNVNARPLEELVESYKLIFNNNTDFSTRPSSPGMSNIDLALTSPGLGPLRVWEIPEEYSSLSDHELILMEWEDIDTPGQGTAQGAMTGWNIQNLLEDDKLLEAAKSDWKRLNDNHQFLDLFCTKQELDKEVEWFQKKLTDLLNNHAKISSVTAYSKRWWNKEVAEARSTWAKDKRRLGRNKDFREEFKQARNRYYRTVRKAKRECWQNFLQGKAQSPGAPIEKNHCWMTLKYSKPLQFRTTPILKDSDENTAISMKAKEAMVRRSAFPKPPINLSQTPAISSRSAHTNVNEEVVAQAFVEVRHTDPVGVTYSHPFSSDYREIIMFYFLFDFCNREFCQKVKRKSHQ